jgi:hypothetical protein
MAIQILAVRLNASQSENVRQIAEVIWRGDSNGKCAALDRAAFAQWMIKNPDQVVYVRDYLGAVTRVATFVEAGQDYIQAVAGAGSLDTLLALPRFVTPTS